MKRIATVSMILGISTVAHKSPEVGDDLARPFQRALSELPTRQTKRESYQNELYSQNDELRTELRRKDAIIEELARKRASWDAERAKMYSQLSDIVDERVKELRETDVNLMETTVKAWENYAHEKERSASNAFMQLQKCQAALERKPGHGQNRDNPTRHVQGRRQQQRYNKHLRQF